MFECGVGDGGIEEERGRGVGGAADERTLIGSTGPSWREGSAVEIGGGELEERDWENVPPPDEGRAVATDTMGGGAAPANAAVVL